MPKRKGGKKIPGSKNPQLPVYINPPGEKK
jgi:hypothetical protein